MPEETKGKPRKKMVVEEVTETAEQPKSVSSETPKIEVPPQTEPHIEPGIHEEVKPSPQILPRAASTGPTGATGPNALVIIIPGIFLLGALLGGIFFYQGSVNRKASPTPSQVAEVTPPPSTPEPKEVDIGKYSISILNGSGIKGEAGKAQDILEKAGFKVSSTGNASNYNYTETIIQAKSSIEEQFITKLKETLGETYKVASKIQSLSSSSKDEVVVIVGSTAN